MQPYLKAGLLVLSGMSVLIFGGCAPPPGPGPGEGILAGNWSLTTDQPSDLPPTVVSFDSTGKFTQIAYQVDGVTITQVPIDGSTLVSGNTVNISQTLTTGSSLDFVGQLNSANTQITGSLIATLNISILSIQVSDQPATLTRQ
jgi:hypothetical protein